MQLLPIFFIIWFLVGWISGNAKLGFEVALISFPILIIAFFIFIFTSIGRGNRREKIEQGAAESMARTIAQQHAVALGRRKYLLTKEGPYGSDDSAWQREKKKFREKMLSGNGLLLRHSYEVDRILDEIASNEASSAKRSLIVHDEMSPTDFEAFCAKRLTELGWQAGLTIATGDQGADVVAKKNGITLIIQCKLYKWPVGNKAVQEAFSAMAHYEGAAAAVVTNSTFTPSAHQLAKSTGVLLLHYSDLKDLQNLTM